MPTVTLTDITRDRLSAVSFFLLLLLVCARGVQAIWNGLRADFPRWPRLSFGKAVGLMTLWGLLFVLVLTMISGARELLTPGAWTKVGFTYRLAEPPSPTPPAPEVGPSERRERLERLRAALWTYAHLRDGRFPPDRSAPEIDADLWLLPGPTGLTYLYVPGSSLGEAGRVVAYEPGLYGDERLTLFADGEVRPVTLSELRGVLEKKESKP
jgi:hypothetical protein